MHILMAQLSSFAQACCKGFNERSLRTAISFEAQHGYRNMYHRTMRFSSFLHANLSRWSTRSDHTPTERILEEVGGYNNANMTERSKVLKKVSLLLGYSSVEDLIEQEKLQKDSDGNTNGMLEEFDFASTRTRFPCIAFGDSSVIELYDKSASQQERALSFLSGSSNGYFPPLVGERNTSEVSEALHLFNSPASGINSLPADDDSSLMLYNIQEMVVESETKPNVEVKSKKSSKATRSSSVYTNFPAETILDTSVRHLPNLTSRQCSQLEDSSLPTVRKLLHHFPRTYADMLNMQDEIEDGQYVIFAGTVLSSRGIKAGSSFSFVEVVVGCECPSKMMIYLHLKKFFRGTRFTNMYFLRSVESKYKEGDRAYVSGQVKQMRMENHFEMRKYTIDVLEDDEAEQDHVERRPYPIYPSKSGLNLSLLSSTISRVLKLLPTNIDPIPDEVLKEFDILNLYDAYHGIHRPKSIHDADLARRRLVFDEFFYMQLGRLFQMLEALGTSIEKENLLDKYKNNELYAIPVDEWSTLTKKLLKALPYSLTPSQLNAVSEIIYDLRRPVPMNRLLQGDVGCGKTVVAFLACMEVVGLGFQAAFMVPTELLAVQHYDHLLAFLENVEDGHFIPSVALLTGSIPTKQSRQILKGLQSGDISLVIGTHSLISEKIEFSALRIAVVDEQHRFGVIQRGRFNSKLYSSLTNPRMSDSNLAELAEDKIHMAPHVLAMSATPIPRTLALALYGDMSLTQITDLPPGRTPVETSVLEGNEAGFENVFQIMRDDLTSGGKVYLVYPIIEESEQLPQLRAANAEFESISKKFESFKCGLLHGRMKSDEKDEALKKFRSGETKILLATQVIEIGVDVPDASMMVVMNAERFGIAQLHQLRGRVGRGERKSKCVFLSSTKGALDRLKVLEESSDGFFLANADLLFRGPGNLLGKKQSGHLPEFPIARLKVDGNLLQEAHLAALKVLRASSDLEKYPRLKSELSMRQPLCILGD